MKIFKKSFPNEIRNFSPNFHKKEYAYNAEPYQQLIRYYHMSTGSKQLPETEFLSLSHNKGNKKANRPALKPITTLPDAMRALGFVPPNKIQPGKVTRFSTNGKRSDTAGWVYLYADNKVAQLASFGCLRSKKRYVWHASRIQIILTYSLIGNIKQDYRRSNTQQSQRQNVQIQNISIADA